MKPFEFSPWTLVELEFVHATHGGGRGRVDNSGNRKLGRALGSVMGLPFEFAFGGSAVGGGGTSAARTARMMQQIDRTAKRAPQVVVKITSRLYGASGTVGAFTYVGRVGMSDKEPIGIETSDGEHLIDARDMLALAREWQAWEQSDEARRKGATAISMVFSMPPGTDPEKVKQAVRELAETDMANRRWVMALHTDADHPHVHLLIAARDNDGRRFNPDREFLRHCRERFAENLRARGIEADATIRKARGYPPKQDPTPVLKMRERGKTPEADQGRVAMIEGRDTNARQRLAGRQNAHGKTAENAEVVRGVYERAIVELRAHGGPEETERARMLQAFVDAMPAPRSPRAEIIERLRTGTALSGEFAKDAELEKLKARVRAREADQRGEQIERIAKGIDKIRDATDQLRPDRPPRNDDMREPSGKDGEGREQLGRIQAGIDRIKSASSALGEPAVPSGPGEAKPSTAERARALKERLKEAPPSNPVRPNTPAPKAPAGWPKPTRVDEQAVNRSVERIKAIAEEMRELAKQRERDRQRDRKRDRDREGPSR